MPELDRRDFLKLVGVGAGAAAAAGCSDPVEKLIPYVVQPDVITPGIPVYYASTCRECSAGCGLHVKVREGRAIKLEGNPDSPVNHGRLCARGQAVVQGATQATTVLWNGGGTHDSGETDNDVGDHTGLGSPPMSASWRARSTA